MNVNHLEYKRTEHVRNENSVRFNKNMFCSFVLFLIKTVSQVRDSRRQITDQQTHLTEKEKSGEE